MRLVIQRVKKATVSLADSGQVVGEIGQGLFVLVGVKKGDTKVKAEKLAEKLAKLRIMADKKRKMNLSVQEVGKEVLVVSQFTLCADTHKGNRPSFIQAAKPKTAEKLYQHFISILKSKGLKVATGQFGAYMEIKLLLDGPVTILLED